MTSRREKLILGIGVAVFILVAFIVSIAKYFHFGYNGFDLAIYNQTFWNTIRGNWFGTSINPPSYLGDHAEWPILLLAPFYALIPHPFTLLFLKIVCVGLSAIPVWMIAKIKFVDPRTRLLFPFIWLTNPFVWNITLFEFHLITFAIPTTFLIAYFFLRDRYLPFLIAIFVLLITREDMAFIAVGFAMLAGLDILIKKKGWRKLLLWTIVPIALAITVFLIDQKIINHFNPDGSYKFFLYYEWLGRTPVEIISSIFTHPIRTFLHLLAPINFQFFFVLLMPILFVPLLRPRFLLIIALTSLEYMLTKNGADLLIVKSQYAAAFIPAVMIASMEGYERLINKPLKFISLPQPLTSILIATATIYTWFALGPGITIINNFKAPTQRTQALIAAAKIIPPDASVVASMDTLTAFSSRQNVWPMSYFWIGKKQFGTSDYVLPQNPDYIVLDQQDVIYFTLVYKKYSWSEKIYSGSAERFRKFLTDGNYGAVFNQEGIAVLKREAGGELPFVQVDNNSPLIQNKKVAQTGPLTFLGWNRATNANETELFFSIDTKIDADLVLKINNKYYPLGNGLYTVMNLEPGKIIRVAVPVSAQKMTITPVTISGGLNLNPNETIAIIIDGDKPVGEAISIP